MKNSLIIGNLVCGLVVVAPAMAGQHLDGRYAYYQAASTAQADRGPRNDADCRQFIALNIEPGVTGP